MTIPRKTEDVHTMYVTQPCIHTQEKYTALFILVFVFNTQEKKGWWAEKRMEKRKERRKGRRVEKEREERRKLKL